MRTHVQGTVYLLHFTVPYRRARHYMGWTESLPARLALHTEGRGARLVEVVIRHGIGFVLARTWTGDRFLERKPKGRRMAPRYCSICRAGRRRRR
jgi:phosphoglycolate phosphatase-like HAD superfamily hydrolase